MITALTSQLQRDDPGSTVARQEGGEPTQTDERQDDAGSREPDERPERDRPTDLSLDLVFEILKNSRRREVLHYLKQRRERVTLSDLAEHVAALENDTTVQGLSSQQRKRVYVGLYQCHLPKLDDMDVVEFNQSRGHVELGPNAQQLDEYLYQDEDDEGRPWPRYYLGYAAAGLVVSAGATATGTVASPAAAALCFGLVLGLGGVAVAHSYDERGSLLP